MSRSSEEDRQWMQQNEESDDSQWQAMDELFWAIEHEQTEETK